MKWELLFVSNYTIMRVWEARRRELGKSICRMKKLSSIALRRKIAFDSKSKNLIQNIWMCHKPIFILWHSPHFNLNDSIFIESLC